MEDFVQKKFTDVLALHKQIADWDIRRLDDIRKTVEDLHRGSGSGPIYSIHIDENKENAMFISQVHLNIIVMSEVRYNCSSNTAKDFYFSSVNKRFWTGCVRHFCQKFTFLFLSVDFHLIDFCVM